MKPYFKWMAPILLFLLIAPWTPSIDLETARMSYTPPVEGLKGYFVQNSFLEFVFNYGEYPAWIACLTALIFIILSYVKSNLKKWRKPALVYLLTFIIGVGLISHLLLKQFWERPRPKQLIEFGGFASYHPFWAPLTEPGPEHARSFPCGHCTMGFVFFAFCLIGWRLKNKWFFSAGIVLTIGLGVGMSLMRIVQGGHFVSDTMASALILWLSALTADAFVYRHKEVI